MTDVIQTQQGLYMDERGTPISTHSMLKTFRRCPKQAQYKYVERLKPKVLGRPLRAGTWFHALLEAYYKGEDWEAIHQRFTHKFADLFDEERERIGDLPRDMKRLMKSYLWHYKEDPWKVHDVEFLLETEFPDGTIYRAKIDLLVENQFGLWIVDHKTNKKTPDLSWRLKDAQSALYIWAALKNKIPVQGHIWNYVLSKPPTMPQLLKDGSRLSKREINTDYPTLLRAIKQYGLDKADYMQWLRYLYGQRYQHGALQTSPFFQRSILEKSPAMLRQVATEAYHTSKRMHSYDFAKLEGVERVVDRSCSFSCNYEQLCTIELFGGNPQNIRRQQFSVGDPLDYYNDDRFEDDKQEVH
jgi:hypothetical protein